MILDDLAAHARDRVPFPSRKFLWMPYKKWPFLFQKALTHFSTIESRWDFFYLRN